MTGTEEITGTIPLISIIIPVYNTPVVYLKKSIDSAMQQKGVVKEIIIVDDGSDNSETLQLLKETEINPEVHVIYQENQGVSVARYTGIREASGRYVVFLDSDDMLHASACFRLLQMIEESEADIAEVCGETVIDIVQQDINCDVELQGYKAIHGSGEIMNALLESCEIPLGWNLWGKIFIKEKLAEKYVPHREIYRGEDVVTLAEYVTACHKVVYSDEKLYYYNQGNESSVTKKNDYKSLTIADAWIVIYHICKNNGYENLYDRVGAKVCENLISVVSGIGVKHALDYFDAYRNKLKQFKKYKRYLSKVNQVKMIIILYLPWIYGIKCKRDTKK